MYGCSLYLKTAEVASEMNLEFAASFGSYVGKVCSDPIEFHSLLVVFLFVCWGFFLLFFKQIERKQAIMTQQFCCVMGVILKRSTAFRKYAC